MPRYQPTTISWAWSVAVVYHSPGGGHPALHGGAPSCGAFGRGGKGVGASVCGRHRHLT